MCMHGWATADCISNVVCILMDVAKRAFRVMLVIMPQLSWGNIRCFSHACLHSNRDMILKGACHPSPLQCQMLSRCYQHNQVCLQ